MISKPRTFIRSWLKQKGISVDERGTFNSKNQNDNEVMRSLILDYNEQIESYNIDNEKKVKPVSNDMLKMAVQEFVSEEVLIRRTEIAEKLKFVGTEDTTQMIRYVKAVTGTDDPKVVTVLSHWIWQIKRRLFDEEVVFHIMPILVGPQEGGKSSAMKQLVTPISKLVLDTELSVILDTEKSAFTMNRNFVALLDEMTGARKADVEALKRKVTASHVDAREFFTQTYIKVKQNCSFIGTSNISLAEILFDTTGMRRFYQIHAMKTLDWQEINTIDYVALFRGINENRARGYLQDQAQAIAAEQQKLVGKDEVGSFVELYNIDAKAALADCKPIIASDIYDLFKAWCESNGAKLIVSSVFGRKLAGLGIQISKEKRGGKTTTIYHINEDSGVHKKHHDPLAVTTTRRDS